ncbi:hypothetical protein V502_08439 [Pseudogymnoascus sp. VKM F-4520 (FW-2644)]|nr:hypothetical protein V502_08439 [Pseudogymnoascus sp. VKM F-4520 (FW-2644)]
MRDPPSRPLKRAIDPLPAPPASRLPSAQSTRIAFGVSSAGAGIESCLCRSACTICPDGTRRSWEVDNSWAAPLVATAGRTRDGSADMTRGELGRDPDGRRRRDGVLVSARRMRVCPSSIPYLSFPKLSSGQLSFLPARAVVRIQKPLHSPSRILFSRACRAFPPTISGPSRAFRDIRGAGWWFGGDRATRGRETLEREGGWSTPGVS